VSAPLCGHSVLLTLESDRAVVSEAERRGAAAELLQTDSVDVASLAERDGVRQGVVLDDLLDVLKRWAVVFGNLGPDPPGSVSVCLDDI